MQHLGSIVSLLKYSAIALVALYFLVAIGLTMLSARLRLSGAWMSWIPFINLFQLCRLAQSSLALVIPALIPGVGFIVLGYLGARIAKRLGQPGILGAMFGVPLLGAMVPIPLAIMSAPPAPEPGQGNTRPASLGLGMVGAMLGIMLLVVGAFLAMGFLTQRKALAADQVVATLPKHTSGTLTEFPLDTDKVRPAKPGNVITQNFGPLAQAKNVTVKVTEKQLPPWISPASLPVSAESLAAAEYRVLPNDTPVVVVTLMLREGETPAMDTPSKKEIAQAGPDATATGIEVKSSMGDIYRGYRVKTANSAYYGLKKNNSNVGVVISAEKGADLEMAERLALNVGNGKGLLEYEEYAGAFGELPAAPTGTELGEVTTFTDADIDNVVMEFDKEIASEAEMQNPAISDLISQAKLILPSRVSLAQYQKDGEQTAFAAVAGYPNSRSSWLALQAIGFLSSNATSIIKTISGESDIPNLPSVQSITIGNSSGYTGTMEHITVILLRREGSIVVMAGDGEGVNVKTWAEAYAAR